MLYINKEKKIFHVRLYGKKLPVLMYMIIILFYTILPVNAQEKELQLIDARTKEAVPGAHYFYGDSKGISNAHGYIPIIYNPKLVLLLSHIEYGKREFSPAQVEDALREGHLRLNTGQPRMLQPLTIRAMRNRGKDGDLLPLSDYDRLSHDAGSYLSYSPAISVIRKAGNYGFDPVLRGFKYEQVNLVIDGVQTALAACPSRMDPPASQISLNQMEQVEILKGPYFLRYGPSIGGAINFISAKPDFGESFEPEGRLSTSYESNGNVIRTEGVIGFRDKDYLLNLNGSWSAGDDYTDGSGIKIPAAFSRGSFGANAAYALSGNQRIGLTLTRNIARDVIFAGLPMDLRRDDTWLLNTNYDIEFQGRHLSDWKTTGYLTRVNHMMDNLEKDLDPRMVNAVTEGYTLTWGGRSEITLNYGLAMAYIGADLHIEKADGTRTREMLMGPMAGNILEDNVWQNGVINRTGIFAEYQLKREPLDYVFSGRFELNDSEITDMSEEFCDIYEQTRSTQLNSSFSAGISSEISSGWTAGLWLGRGMRSGSLTERYINYFPVGLDPYELIGNPELKPEVNNQADIDIKFKQGSTLFEMDVFVSYLQDYISSEIIEGLDPRLPSSPGVRQFINLDEATMSGFEVQWRQYLWAHLDVHMGMAYTYGKNLESGEPLPEIPPFDLRIALSGHFINNVLRPEVSFRHAAGQNRIAGSYGETTTPGYSVVDARITYDLNRNIHLAGGIQNAFDVAYYEHLSRSVRDQSGRPIYSPGRSYYITVSVDFMD